MGLYKETIQIMKKEIKFELKQIADALIETLDTETSAKEADKRVAKCAKKLYKLLNISGKIVVDDQYEVLYFKKGMPDGVLQTTFKWKNETN